MATPNTSAHPESRPRYWLRVLRPLQWWFLLVLVLYGIRTHQRLMQQTRLMFTATVNKRTDYSEPTATLDGAPAFNGQLITLGNHVFTVTHPKGESFSTNLFIWYGGRDLGAIGLKRSKGVLSVSVNPPAPLLSIRGPEFEITLTNSTGLSTSVPTDQYEVEARYRHWEKSQPVTVSANIPNNLAIAPRLGALRLECDQSEATFQLQSSKGEELEAGNFPATVLELPEGKYQLLASHHDHRWTEMPGVQAGATNTMRVEMKYGAVILETKPPSATVMTGANRDLGATPLKLTELQPGSYNVTLRLDNYESVSVSFSVTANETKTIQTNLVALSYTGAMQAGRRYLAAADFDHAIESLDDALRVQPNDPVATTLQREATGRRCLQRAKALGEKGDYIAGGLELKTALTLLPDNEQAKRMVADFKQHEPEQLERERVERLNRGKKVFAAILQQHGDADLFESYELKTTKPVKEVEEAIVAAFQIQPALPVTKRNSTAPETFFVETAQEYSTFLATSAGRRQCLVVGAQTRDDETQILYKVLEFKTEAVNKFSIGAVLGTPVEVKYVPIHPSRVGVLTEKFKTRLKEGVSNVTARIQGAIGQPPTGQPTIPK